MQMTHLCEESLVAQSFFVEPLEGLHPVMETIVTLCALKKCINLNSLPNALQKWYIDQLFFMKYNIT